MMTVPTSVRALSSLPAVHYGDLFTLDTAATAAPEQWARAMFGDVPGAGELFIWRVVLGFRLSRGRSPSTVGGWRIGGRGEDWIRLETASALLSANMIVRTAAGRVTWATLLHYDHPVGGFVWPPLSAVHRRLVPRVLRAGEARLLAASPAG